MVEGLAESVKAFVKQADKRKLRTMSDKQKAMAWEEWYMEHCED